MLGKTALAGLVLMLVLSTAPLPHSEEGPASLAGGGTWHHDMEISSTAHVTYIVRSSSPVDVTMVREGDKGEVVMSSNNGTSLYRFSGSLSPGTYRLIVTNPGTRDVEIEYQVHQDFIVIANMTAKNVMGLSLALAIGIVALLLHSRPRRT